MNTATRDLLALVLAYLEDFARSLGPVWGANGCLLSLWEDGSLDQAVQALRACDPRRAADMLAMAAEQASQPVSPDEHKASEARQERDRIALAVRVALALLERATEPAQATSAGRHPHAILSPDTPAHARDTDAPLDLPDSWADVEPLPEDLILVFEMPDLGDFPPLPGAPAGAACLPPSQG